MALIGSGWRQVHQDYEGNRYVMFDDGVYALDSDVKIERSEGEEWTWCESHNDDEEEIAHALIGGVMMPVAGPSAEGFEFGKVDSDDDGKPDEDGPS